MRSFPLQQSFGRIKYGLHFLNCHWLYLGPGGLDNKERRARVGRVKSYKQQGYILVSNTGALHRSIAYVSLVDSVEPVWSIVCLNSFETMLLL